MREINDFKNDAWKVERVPNIFENLNYFETMLKMLKNDANVLKTYFFWIFNVFRYFWIFLKIYQNMGQKLGSNRCPLFTMLTKQNSSMFCIVSFVKKIFFFFRFVLRSHRAISLNQNQNLRGWGNLRSRPAIPFNQNQYPVCGWANLRSRPAIPFNQNQNEIPSGDLIKPKLKKCV